MVGDVYMFQFRWSWPCLMRSWGPSPAFGSSVWRTGKVPDKSLTWARHNWQKDKIFRTKRHCLCVCVCVIWPTIHNVPGSLCFSVLSCKCWANVWEARLDELPLMEVLCCSTLNMVTWSKYTNNAWFLPTTALNRMWTNCSHPIFSLFVSIIREWEQNNRHPI